MITAGGKTWEVAQVWDMREISGNACWEMPEDSGWHCGLTWWAAEPHAAVHSLSPGRMDERIRKVKVQDLVG